MLENKISKHIIDSLHDQLMETYSAFTHMLRCDGIWWDGLRW